MLYILHHDYSRAFSGPKVAEVRTFGPFDDTIEGRNKADEFIKTQLLNDNQHVNKIVRLPPSHFVG